MRLLRCCLKVHCRWRWTFPPRAVGVVALAAGRCAVVVIEREIGMLFTHPAFSTIAANRWRRFGFGGRRKPHVHVGAGACLTGKNDALSPLSANAVLPSALLSPHGAELDPAVGAWTKALPCNWPDLAVVGSAIGVAFDSHVANAATFLRWSGHRFRILTLDLSGGVTK